MRPAFLILAFGLALSPCALEAQLVPMGGQRQQRQPDPSDTIRVPPFRVEPPVSPLGAAVRSLLIPGWGQSIVGRKATGAVFIFWEGLTLAMMLKSAHQLDYQSDIEQEELEGKRTEVQDWAVLLAFNHLLAAAEAYVSTHLWDFPADLGVQPLESGDVAAGMRVYW
jgi:hypothetical protein